MLKRIIGIFFPDVMRIAREEREREELRKQIVKDFAEKASRIVANDRALAASEGYSSGGSSSSGSSSSSSSRDDDLVGGGSRCDD